MSEVSTWQEKFTVLPAINSEDGRRLIAMHPLGHTHFVSYGGEYYCYLYAQNKAQEIWDLHFAENPLNIEAGKLLWKTMLKVGAAKNSEDILTEILSAPGGGKK